MDIFLATGNAHKAEEFGRMFAKARLDVRVRSADDGLDAMAERYDGSADPVWTWGGPDDVRGTLTPQLRTDRGDTRLVLVDLGAGRDRLGGSCLAQVYGRVGGEAPDCDILDGGPVEQHGPDRLRAIGPVGTLGDANLAEIIGRGLSASDRSHDLTADRVGLGMQHFGNDLDGLAPAGKLRRAQREAGAPPQLDPHRDPAIA